jgi:hypothetical protein
MMALTLKRKCGDCTVCCTVMAVESIDKPGFEKCPHECGKCGIYETRPPECARFKCLWLEETLHVDDRPDKLGVMFFVGQTVFSRTTVHAMEVEEGAIEGDRARLLIIRMAEKFPVVLIAKNGKRSLVGGSQMDIDRVQRAIARREKENGNDAP